MDDLVKTGMEQNNNGLNAMHMTVNNKSAAIDRGNFTRWVDTSPGCIGTFMLTGFVGINMLVSLNATPII
jgi:hypothetical protein